MRNTVSADNAKTKSRQIVFQKIDYLSMDTRFVESFIRVAEHGSIAEAARRLNLTPAGVAQQIGALEREIGTALLVRVGRTVKPTEAGVRILDRSRQLVRDTADLASIANDATVAGELRLGAVVTAVGGLLPQILAPLSAKYPQLGVRVVPGESRQLYRQVCEAELDAALIAKPEFNIPKICDWHVLRNEPLVVLVPSSSSYKSAEDALVSAPFIRYDRSTVGGKIADSYLRRAGIQPQDRFELNSLYGIAMLVDKGLGVSLVPDWSPPWPAGIAVSKLGIAEEGYARQIGVLWSRSSPRLRLIHALLQEA
jgi:DNA-binding transcriptional LysR family regulator